LQVFVAVFVADEAKKMGDFTIWWWGFHGFYGVWIRRISPTKWWRINKIDVIEKRLGIWQLLNGNNGGFVPTELWGYIQPIWR
jgi:hypothetical protein